ncbi:hypothetical protein PE36_06167 [Moritella sp. PE36]|nr:hypothetical protein PE36_06167 [Moritella sp. PE36]
MARNKIQFQKGISIHQLIEKYGTEIQCHNNLFDMRWPRSQLIRDGDIALCYAVCEFLLK